MPSRVVFVPGFMQRGEAWAEVAALVAERYPSVCVEHAANDAEGRIQEISETVGPDDVLVGYSLGGRLSMHAVVRGLRPRSLVLVGASAGIENPAEREARRAADEELAAWMERSTIDEIVERWERQPIFATQPADLVARQRRGRASHDPRGLAALLRTGGQGTLEPLWSDLPAIACPVLAIAGQLDSRYADAARRIAALVADGRAELIARAGHAPQLERPRETADAISDFLDR